MAMAVLFFFFPRGESPFCTSFALGGGQLTSRNEMKLNLRSVSLLPITATLLATACTVSTDDNKKTAATDSAAVAANPLPATTPAMSIDSTALADTTARTSAVQVEVDITARRLHVMNGGDTTGTYPVAVGSSKWPTKTGSWRITQVVWNPDWVPPDESWAEEREPRSSGDPKNPLGRVQLVYDPPRTIHGTNAPSSIGKAVSHGSIRVTNQVGIALGKQLIESAGVAKDSAFYRDAQQNRSTKQVVDLPGGVPIRVF